MGKGRMSGAQRGPHTARQRAERGGEVWTRAAGWRKRAGRQ